MSTLSYRDWKIWLNLDYFDGKTQHEGRYELSIAASLMSKQTVQFIYEKSSEIRAGQFKVEDNILQMYIAPQIFPAPHNEFMVLTRIEPLIGDIAIPAVKIEQILRELNALSLSVDFPLYCDRLQYTATQGGSDGETVFIANRKAFVRGLGFSVEEREFANSKLQQDFRYYLDSDMGITSAGKHYLAGLTLLGLEDTYPGLIDAAFMQFYQGCEILCGGGKGGGIVPVGLGQICGASYQQSAISSRGSSSMYGACEGLTSGTPVRMRSIKTLNSPFRLQSKYSFAVGCVETFSIYTHHQLTA